MPFDFLRQNTKFHELEKKIELLHMLVVLINYFNVASAWVNHRRWKFMIQLTWYA